MTTKTTEQRLAAVEKTLKTVQRQAERAYAATECLRMVSRYAYTHAAGKGRQWYLECFSKKQKDIAVGHGQMGIMVGKEHLEKRLFAQREEHVGDQGGRKGWIFMHPTASPYIEVAADGKTAKGIFLSIGLESSGDKRGVLTPAWGWGCYGVDFIKEDGEWKIWHFHINRIFRGDYFQSWITYNPDIEPGYYTVPDDQKYDKPPKDDCPYRPTENFTLKPDPPEPYETWDPKTSYC